MSTYTRTNNATGEQTVLTLDEAVDQFTRDNHAYEAPDEDVEDYLNDMVTVFETQSLLKGLSMLDVEDVGGFTYTRK